ncbi:MAG TPA: DUF2846 domain-containing protein [Verrucomicrobia bacterium]|nr:DUF2846 domain-containing protein [Verrucomicrobiota bacterium]HOB33147.1 hypothetical protein [Verrucomicrobiota bacterium]HOP97684.1 hypothetical protein [Verrucomicrobiota bacterium]HPU55465.1 hypothetical protein [Verrucomicrobiota bacterium]
MNFARTALLLTGVVALTGCSSTWQYVRLPDPSTELRDASRSRIYVIRAAESESRAHVDVADDKRIVGSTAPGGYLCWERPPGRTVISSRSSRITLSAEPGKTYYLLQTVTRGRLFADSTLKLITPEEGAALLKDRPRPLRCRLNGSLYEESTWMPGALVFTGY